MPRFGDLTRRDLRGMLSQRVGDYLDGVSTGAGTVTSILDNTRLEGSLGLPLKPGNYIYFPTGMLAGQERLVGTFIWGSLMTFAPALPTMTVSGTIYELHNYSVNTYNNALKRSEARLRDFSWLIETVEMMWTTDVFEMSLGGTVLDTVASVQFYDGGTGGWYELDGPYRNPKAPAWRVTPGMNPLLSFRRNWFTQPGNGATIRIMGQRRPYLMTLESDTCEINEGWVLDLAEMEIHESRDVGNRDASQRTARATNAWQRFMLQKGMMRGPLPNSIPFRQGV